MSRFSGFDIIIAGFGAGFYYECSLALEGGPAQYWLARVWSAWNPMTIVEHILFVTISRGKFTARLTLEVLAVRSYLSQRPNKKNLKKILAINVRGEKVLC